MITRWLFILLLTPLWFNVSASTSVDFYRGSLSNAKEMAAQEGKLYFVEFTASWCMPCRWMDETTFTDPTLSHYINQNYIPVKVDIDDFDGYAYKQMYNIKVLPTILVFNSKGELLAKHAESLPPTKMLNILKQHDTPNNRVKSVKARPPAPKEVHSPIVTRPAPQPPKVDRPAPTAAPTTPVAPAQPVAQGDGLYRFNVIRQASSGFSIQIGAFQEYGNVLREVAKLQTQFQEAILVHIVRSPDKTVYKILIGEFANREAANNYRVTLKKKGTDGIIKDLSTMK